MQSDIERKWDFQKQFLFLCDCMNFLHRVSLNWTDLIPWKMDQLMYFIVIYRSALQCNEIQEDTGYNNFYWWFLATQVLFSLIFIFNVLSLYSFFIRIFVKIRVRVREDLKLHLDFAWTLPDFHLNFTWHNLN